VSDLAAWQAEPLTPEMREQHFADSRSFAGEIERLGRSHRRLGFVVGTSGMAIGVAGMVCAAWMFTRPIPPQRYIEVDSSTGWVGETIGSRDAPKLFNDRVVESALRSYVEDREAFVPETDDLAFHRVAIKSLPDEQARYALAHDPRRSPTTAPFVVYGRGGFARTDNFHMTKRGMDPKTKTYDYVVHFFKTDAKGGQLTVPRPWTVEMQFQFHPELPMNQPDRLLNETGLQVVSYSAYPDSEAPK
jgi:type IV secretory pathway component VirB8